ncbi:MAG: tetratricopeptide repeat protein, partial [Fervidicoccaceae archaeon]
PLYREALEIKIRSLGRNHPDVAATMSTLAVLYFEQGKYSEAEPLYREALEILIKSLGRNHPDVAATMSTLALLYFEQGKYSEAKMLLLDALEIYKTLNEESNLYEEKIELIQKLINLIRVIELDQEES